MRHSVYKIAFLVCSAIASIAPRATAAPEPVRLLISIGSNYGHPEDPVLQFAEEDAARMREVMIELGGVADSRAVLLTRPTAERVREKFAELAGRVSELHAQEKSVALFVFVSAHGKSENLHLLGTDLSIDSLRALARETKADLKIVIVDACDSGIAPRAKGASKGAAYTLSLQTPALAGEVFISSSGPHEPAQEWEALGGSLFTHHLLTGLRGDADFDGDGQVSLMEAYNYAAHHTVAESLDLGQHPQFDLGLSGGSELQLTDLKQSGAQVILQAPLEGRFVLASLPNPTILVEVNKLAGRTLTLAVPPGRYLLRHTKGFQVALQELELPYGGIASVDGEKFETRDYSEVAMKGTGPEFHPDALRLSLSESTSPISGAPARWMVGVSYRITRGALWAFAEFAAGHVNYRGDGLETHEWRFAARASAGYRFWLGPIALIPAAGLELSLLRQSYLRDDESVVRQSYGALPANFTTGFAAGPQVWLEAPLPDRCFISLGAMLWLRALPADDQSTLTVGFEGEGALGFRF